MAAAALGEAQRAEYREAFDMFVADGGETVPTTKLATVLRSLGLCPTQAEVAAMAAEAGEALTFDALVGCIQTAMQKTPSQDELLEALTAFDHTGSGTIRVEDLRKVLTEMAEDKLTPDQVEDLIRDGDKYRTGEVSFEFFQRMVSQF